MRKRLPGIRELSMNFGGVDPVTQPIPVKPGQHYTMGGIDTDVNGATEVKGFYAAGECACVSVHGANRLGGNSLLDTLVFGKLSGEHAADYVNAKTSSRQGAAALTQALKEEEEKVKEHTTGTSQEKYAALRDELGRLMTDKVGIYRTEADLSEALTKVKDIQQRYKKVKAGYGGKVFNQALAWTLEVQGNLAVAETIVAGALDRKESRGSHFRSDFPTRNDTNFLNHTLSRYVPAEDGARLSYTPVELGIWEPKERKY